MMTLTATLMCPIRRELEEQIPQPLSLPSFHLLWYCSVARQEARGQGNLLMSYMLVSLLDTEQIRESWRGDLEVQMEIT